MISKCNCRLISFISILALLPGSFLVMVQWGDGIGTTRSFTDEPIMWGTADVDIGDIGSRFFGEDNADHAGHCVAGIGDVNGDGIDDFAIGAYSNDENEDTSGQVYIFFGRSDGFPANTSLSSADASFQGVGEDDRAGIDISGAGDVNGDGYDDIIIGADEYQALGTSGRGRAYLILGRSGGWSMDTSLSNANASWYGEANEDMFGRAVGGGGDVNGDGYDDLVIGAYDNEEGGDIRGQTYIIFGRSGNWSRNQDIGTTANASYIGVEEKEQSGYSVDIVGDTNGDGFDDILIGARYFTNSSGGSRIGHAYLIMGRSTGWSADTPISSSNATFVGQNSLAGSHVSGAGDVNGDDLADFLVTEHMNSEYRNTMGQTYLILGNRDGWSNGTRLSDIDASFWGEEANDECGFSAEGGGDINGDGFDDLILGSYRNQDGGKDYPYYAGKIYVVYGRENGWRNDISLSEADASFIGEQPGGAFGYNVANAGDVNNDGFDDILSGAWMGDFNGMSNNGIAYLINRTPSEVVTGFELDTGDNSTPLISLSWDEGQGEPFQYGIYKGSEPSALERYANTTEPFFNDNEVTVDHTYYYAVVRFCPLGMESDISEILSGNVTIEPEDNTTDPEDNTTEPEDNSTTPVDNTTDPEDNSTTPFDNETIPEDNTTVSEDNSTTSIDNSTEPGDNMTDDDAIDVPKPDDDRTEEKDKDDDPGDPFPVIIPIIGVVILLLIFIFIFILVGKRKKDEEE